MCRVSSLMYQVLCDTNLGSLCNPVCGHMLTCVGINVRKPEFGIRNTFKKLVISIIFSIFVVENQYIINKEYYHYGDYQRQNYRNFLYYR